MKDTLHIYTRVSQRSQEEGSSLESQKELGIQKSKDLGMKHKLWNEGAQSSHHEDLLNRPKIVELLQDIENGKVKHLFVYNNDRLSRNDQTQFIIKKCDNEKWCNALHQRWNLRPKQSHRQVDEISTGWSCRIR